MSDFQAYSDSHKVEGSDWNYLISHGLVKEVSYIIDKPNSTYRAINGSTGNLLISGPSDTTVINTAINDLTSGGKIFLKGGTHTINLSSGLGIRVKDHISIAGEGIGKTILQLANSQAIATQSAALISNYNWGLGGSFPNVDIELKDLTIDFNKAGQVTPNTNVYHIGVVMCSGTNLHLHNIEVKNAGTWGIGLYGADDTVTYVDNIILDDVFIHDCGGGNAANYDGGVFVSYNQTRGVHLDTVYSYNNNGHGLCLEDGVSESDIVHSFFYKNKLQGIFIYGGAVGSKYLTLDNSFIFENGENVAGHGHGVYATANIENLKIKNSHIWGNYFDGINVRSETSGLIKDLQITGNTLVNNNRHTVHEVYYGGISVTGTDAVQKVLKAIITGNVAYDDQVAKTQEFGFRDNAFVDYLTLKDNDFRDNIHVYYDDVLHATNRIDKDNQGYVTENSGIEEILNGDASVTTLHGIAGVAVDGSNLIVSLGPKHAEVAAAIWSADAAQLIITVPAPVTDDRFISWRAERI